MSEAIGNVESATAIIGNKWTPHLLRYFLNEKTVRFCQLQELVGGINPRTLCARLNQLEKEGIIEKKTIDGSNRCTYQLTPKGQELMPILRSMQEWSKKYPANK